MLQEIAAPTDNTYHERRETPKDARPDNTKPNDSRPDNFRPNDTRPNKARAR